MTPSASSVAFKGYRLKRNKAEGDTNLFSPPSPGGTAGKKPRSSCLPPSPEKERKSDGSEKTIKMKNDQKKLRGGTGNVEVVTKWSESDRETK